MNDSRSDLRNRLSAARSALQKSELDAASEGFAERLLGHLDHHTPSTLAGYMAIGGELDPSPALRSLHGNGWRIVLPVIHAGRLMTFVAWEPGKTRFSRNRLGIAEPEGPDVPPSEISVVVTPGVVFDSIGGRIGHGAGFYDRFFARVADLGHRPVRIGAAHDFQLVERVPAEPWDVPMDVVVTPTRIIFTAVEPIDQP